MDKHFAWMGQNGKGEPAPRHPKLELVVKFVSTFQGAYADRAREKRLTGGKLTQYERMLAKGVTPEEAMASLVDQHVAARTRELDQREKSVAKREATVRDRQRPLPKPATSRPAAIEEGAADFMKTPIIVPQRKRGPDFNRFKPAF